SRSLKVISEHGPELVEFVGDDEVYVDKRPAKAAERRQGREAVREELEDLMDRYPEYAGVPNGAGVGCAVALSTGLRCCLTDRLMRRIFILKGNWLPGSAL